MDFLNNEIKDRFEENKNKILENIKIGKDMGVSKISAILAIDEEESEMIMNLVNWLLLEGYKVSLKNEEYSILTIEWWSLEKSELFFIKLNKKAKCGNDYL